jgi:hypothetical protein
MPFSSVERFLQHIYIYISLCAVHTHTHTHIYIYIYCVTVTPEQEIFYLRSEWLLALIPDTRNSGHRFNCHIMKTIQHHKVLIPENSVSNVNTRSTVCPLILCRNFGVRFLTSLVRFKDIT